MVRQVRDKVELNQIDRVHIASARSSHRLARKRRCGGGDASVFVFLGDGVIWIAQIPQLFASDGQARVKEQEAKGLETEADWNSMSAELVCAKIRVVEDSVQAIQGHEDATANGEVANF